MRIARIKIRVDSQGGWERALGENAILKRCVLSLDFVELECDGNERLF